MDLLFLGTSSGTPTRARNVSALALLEETGKAWYLIDCGEGTQHRLLRTPLSLHDLLAICITHVHGDHCYGLPGLLASAGVMGRKAPLTIIARRQHRDLVRATLSMSQSWLSYELDFHAVETLGEWRSPNMRIEATELSHRVPCYGYSFSEARPDPRLDIDRLEHDGVPRGPLWGQLARGFDIEHEGACCAATTTWSFSRSPRRIVVGGDNDRPDLLAETCRDAQLLVHEATLHRGRGQRRSQRLRPQHGRHRGALRPGGRFAQPGADPLARAIKHVGRGHSIEDLRRSRCSTPASCCSPRITCACIWARMVC